MTDTRSIDIQSELARKLWKEFCRGSRFHGESEIEFSMRMQSSFEQRYKCKISGGCIWFDTPEELTAFILEHSH